MTADQYRRLPGETYKAVQRATAFQPVGWEGSSTSVRFVGGITGAIPASGTYKVGDMVVSTNGTMAVCRIAGTPGTWSQTVTNNTAQSISGVKTFTATPVVPSITINGFTITAVGGDLFIAGVRLAKATELVHNHDTAYAKPPTNNTTTHSHPA